MKAIERVEVPRLAGGRVINLDGGYLGHHEPCDNPDHFKVRYRTAGMDVIKTFEKEK